MLTRLSCLFAPTILIAVVVTGCASAPDPLYDAFVTPPTAHRPFVRWWWNGARIDEREIARELDVMHKAGIGGVEINTIAMPEATPAETTVNHPVHEWLSPGWTRLVRAAADGARARGMVADIIVGSGWPFGGEFLAPEEQIQRVRVLRKEITGPTTLALDARALEQEVAKTAERARPTARRLLFVRLRPPKDEASAFAPGQELLDLATANGTVEVPPGPHTLYVGLWEGGFSHVKLGAPGASGPVVDHFNARAVRRYLDHMSAALGPALGGRMGDALRAAFVDSLELDHANWTGDLPTAFERRHGYALGPYLPYVLDDVDAGRTGPAGDTIRRARHDFLETIVALFHARFLRTYVDWCHANGLKARIQAYGREAHPLEGSLMVDLPEGETWIWRDKVQRERTLVESTVVNRYVSSAARIAGRRLVSFEAMTNAVPVFRETLQDFKEGLDASVLAGLNHPILHGFNYSPPDAGFPGWVRFGSWLNERNPWWPLFPRWTDYAARLSTLLREADGTAEVALLAPRADEWARRGLLYQPFPEAKVPWYQYALADELARHGVGVDFVSESLLQQSRPEAQGDAARLRVGPRAYQLLVVEDAESLAPETAERLRAWAAAGGRLAFVGRAPTRAPGLRDAEARDRQVHEAMATTLAVDPARVAVVPAPEDAPGRLFAFAGELLARFRVTPPVRFAPPAPTLSQARFRAGDRQVLFLSNASRTDTVTTAVQAPADAGAPWRWDPETGARAPLGAAGAPLPVRLGPLESLLVVFEAPGGPARAKGAPGLAAAPAPFAAPGGLPLDDGWDLELAHVDPAHAGRRPLSRLEDLGLSADPTLATFAGVAVYRRQVTLSAEQAARLSVLDLGEVNGASELRIDGQPVGARWYGRHTYDVRSALRPGTRAIEIRVTVMLGNYMKSLAPTNPVAHRWARGFPPVPAGLVGPVRLAPPAP